MNHMEHKSSADPLVTKFWCPHCTDRTLAESGLEPCISDPQLCCVAREGGPRGHGSWSALGPSTVVGAVI